MPSVQKGLGVVWSLATGATGTGIGTFTPQSLDWTQESTEKEILKADGGIGSLVFANQRQTAVLEVVPSGATLALAKAASILPDPGADVTVTDADDTEIAGSGSSDGTGTYIFISGTKRRTVDGETRLVFNLRRYAIHLATVAAS